MHSCARLKEGQRKGEGGGKEEAAGRARQPR